MEGFTKENPKPWPDLDSNPLVELLYHSDCDGDLKWQNCNAIADGLEELLPSLERADGDSPLPFYAPKTRQWIKGLRIAAEQKENPEFR